jgi:hypothetical protein
MAIFRLAGQRHHVFMVIFPYTSHRIRALLQGLPMPVVEAIIERSLHSLPSYGRIPENLSEAVTQLTQGYKLSILRIVAANPYFDNRAYSWRRAYASRQLRGRQMRKICENAANLRTREMQISMSKGKTWRMFYEPEH